MAWQKRLPSLKRLKKLSATTTWEVEPTVVKIADLASKADYKFFVIVEFRQYTFIEYFDNSKDAAAYASAMYLALSLM